MSSSCGQCLYYDVSEWPRQAARTDSQRTNRSGKSLANGSCRSSGHTTGRARTPLELLVCGGAPRRNRTGDPILTMANGEFLPASSKSWIPREIAENPQHAGGMRSTSAVVILGVPSGSFPILRAACCCPDAARPSTPGPSDYEATGSRKVRVGWLTLVRTRTTTEMTTAASCTALQKSTIPR
jgi:hypothetical protein